MKIAVYTICYNELDLLPFFVRHYRQYAEKIVVYDNQSTDGSAELARSLGCEVRTYETGNEVRDDLMLQVKNECWKECKGQGYDWVCVVDVDEIVYHPQLLDYLRSQTLTGCTVLKTNGFQMVSVELPFGDGQIWETHKHGVPTKTYSKACVFSPDSIDDIGFSTGCHKAVPTGNVHQSSSELKLLHYSMLSLPWLCSRMRARKTRLSDLNKKNGWGKQYVKSKAQYVRQHKKTLAASKVVI